MSSMGASFGVRRPGSAGRGTPSQSEVILSLTSEVSVVRPRRRYGCRMPATREPAPLGTLLREWRQRRRVSQFELALDAGVSARHLSFLETGRSRPSRQMVLHL